MAGYYFFFFFFAFEAVAYRDLKRLNGQLVHYVYVDLPLGMHCIAHICVRRLAITSAVTRLVLTQG